MRPGSKSVLLIIEDEPAIRDRIGGILERLGYRMRPVKPGDESHRELDLRRHDAVIAVLEKGDVRRQVRALRRRAGTVPVLLLCHPNEVTSAAAALRHGADDYLLRPPVRSEVESRLTRLLDKDDIDSRLAFFQDEASKRSRAKTPEARSPAMREALERVLRVAPMKSTVLILGESGVGKELVARSIHFNSPRRNGPFVALNCAAMPANLIESDLFGHEKGSFTGAHARVRGKFEIADRGTLFLDEIAETEPATQAKLLRVLDDREFMRIGGDRNIRVDVRVIAATNADLPTLAADSRFRRDLYYRLKVVTIDVPPLRDRRADIPALVDVFLKELSRANAVKPKSLEPAALAALENYRWPGNVRELKNMLESLLVSTLGNTVRLEDLPLAVRQDHGREEAPLLAPGTTLAEMEKELIRRTLEYTGGNRTHSASMLGIGVRTLQRKIQAYHISIPSKRRRTRGDIGSQTR